MHLVMEHAHLAVPSSMVKINVSVLWDLNCLCLEELCVLVSQKTLIKLNSIGAREKDITV